MQRSFLLVLLQYKTYVSKVFRNEYIISFPTFRHFTFDCPFFFTVPDFMYSTTGHLGSWSNENMF